MMNDKFWDNLYWTTELTRPDRLAKMLNIIIGKEDDDNEHFIYNRQMVNEAIKTHSTNVLRQQDNRVHFTYYEKLRLRQIDQQFDMFNRSNTTSSKIDRDYLCKKRILNGTNDQKIFNREETKEFLRQFSADLYLADETIEPRPIDVRLVKIGKITSSTKLFSNTISVRMRLNIHKSPVRCKPMDSNMDGNSKSQLIDRINQLENLFRNGSIQVCLQRGDEGFKRFYCEF